MSNDLNGSTTEARWHRLGRQFNRYVPAILAVLVAVSGITLIYPLAHRVWLGEHLQWFDQVSWRDVIDTIGLIELPRVFMGFCLLLMSVGLVMRARLAWTFSLMVFALALAITVYSDWGIMAPKVGYDLVVVVLLVRYWSLFDRSSLAAGSLFAVASVVSLTFYAMLGTVYLGEQFTPKVHALADAAYFSVVAMSTVGFGDIVPTTHTAKMFVVSVIVLGITVFATSLGAIVGPLVSGKLRQIFREKARVSMRKNHIILCGATPLALSLYRSLTEKGEMVTVVLKPGVAHEYPENADLLWGEASSGDILKQAGVDEASYVLALREDDPDNAFIVLAVKSFTNSKAKTVAVVNASQNLEKIRRVNADMVFSPQLLGAELLARTMTGQPLDNSLISELFFAKPMPADAEPADQAK
jgi:voltage-gated potassium channel